MFCASDPRFFAAWFPDPHGQTTSSGTTATRHSKIVSLADQPCAEASSRSATPHGTTQHSADDGHMQGSSPRMPAHSSVPPSPLSPQSALPSMPNPSRHNSNATHPQHLSPTSGVHQMAYPPSNTSHHSANNIEMSEKTVPERPLPSPARSAAGMAH